MTRPIAITVTSATFTAMAPPVEPSGEKGECYVCREQLPVEELVRVQPPRPGVRERRVKCRDSGACVKRVRKAARASATGSAA